MSDPLPQLTRAVVDAFAPLGTVLSDASLAAGLLAELGVEVALDQGDLDRIATLLPSLARVTAELVPMAERLAAGEGLDAGDALTAVEVADAVRRDLGTLAQGPSAGAVSGLPGPLDDPATWEAIGAALPGSLIAGWIESALPPVHAPLRLGGVVRDTYDPHGRRHREVGWGRLGDLVRDPAGTIGEEYGWGGDLDHLPLLGAIRDAAGAVGLRLRWGALPSDLIAPWYPEGPPSGMRALILGLGPAAEVGVAALPIPAEPGVGPMRGLALVNLGAPASGVEFEVAPGWVVTVTGGAGPADAPALELLPGAPARVTGGAPTVDLGLELRGEPASPWAVAGPPDGLRVTLSGLLLSVGVSGPPDDLRLEAAIGTSGDGVALALPEGSGDGFLSALIPSGVDGGAAATLRWSADEGFSLEGDVGLVAVLVVDRWIGPVYLERLSIALTLGDVSELVLGLTARAVLGPFTCSVEELGLRLTAALADGSGGTLEPLGLGLAFKPPTGVGLELDLGVGGGAGFLWLEPEIGRYSGALGIDLVEIGLAAIGVVDTQLPGDPDGFALFLSISATFPGLPLGFGFFLSGVGGILCLNRTMDALAIADGLKSGAVDALLFPEDPLEDAPLIIGQLDSWFPIAPGSTVVGVAARITWGLPTLITGDLAVVLSFPEIELAVLGSVSMVLPDEETALVELHMDTLGVIDTSAGVVSITASLYDSTLLRTIHLSGDMAMYARIGDDPYFLLSIGGYNPHFDPPGDLPASVTDLRRMRADVTLSEDVWLGIEAYVAVTSNTLQFGSLAEIEASDRFLGVTYTAHAEVGFDVLLVFSPFAFIADVHASAEVTAGDRELLAVDLRAHVEGPQPWYVTGSASFDFFGIDVSFAVSVGWSSPPAARPAEDVRELVVTALEDPASWAPRAPADAAASPVVLDAPEVEGEVWVRPDGELVATQTVAPLDREMDVFGEYAIAGPRRLDLDAAGIDKAPAATWSPATDWFAPALYDEMTRAEKLEAPSFEAMTAGAAIGCGAAAVDAGEATSVTPDYEVAILEPDETRRLALPRPLAVPLATAAALRALDPSRPRPPRAVTSEAFAVGETRWRTADAITGIPFGVPTTWRAASTGLRATVAADPSLRGARALVPSYAAGT
jgi:hypothetical protein